MARKTISPPPVILDDNLVLKRMERLEEYLLAPMAGRTQAWGERVGWALGELQEAVAQHQAEAEAHAGPCAPEELKGPIIPAMDARVDQLRQEPDRLRADVRAI